MSDDTMDLKSKVLGAVRLAYRPDLSVRVEQIIERQWDNGLEIWTEYLAMIGSGVTRVTKDRVTWTILIDGFGGDSTRGMVAIQWLVDGRPVLGRLPGLVGDFGGGFESEDMALTLVDVDHTTGCLTAVDGAASAEPGDITADQIREFAKVLLEWADTGTAAEPGDGGWWGENTTSVN